MSAVQSMYPPSRRDRHRRSRPASLAIVCARAPELHAHGSSANDATTTAAKEGPLIARAGLLMAAKP